LTLRGCVAADFDAYAAIWQDPRVTAFIGGTPRPRDESWRRFCQGVGMWPLLGYGYWAVVRGDVLIGVAGFAHFERAMPLLEGFPEAGWAFAADAWGQGYATEVVAALVNWADAQGIAETRCIIDAGNAASRKVAARSGYRLIAAAGGGPDTYARLRAGQPKC